MAIPADMQTILQDVFGFDGLRPGQAHIIETVMRNEHVLAVMPTGAGKIPVLSVARPREEGDHRSDLPPSGTDARPGGRPAVGWGGGGDH